MRDSRRDGSAAGESEPALVAAPGHDVEARLSAMELRLAAVEELAERAWTYAAAANHLSKTLDPRTLVLTSQLSEVHRAVDELRSFATDLERMAAALWDETALARRLARIEDALLDVGKPAAPSEDGRAQPS